MSNEEKDQKILVKLEQVLDSVEAMRSQNSAEHGSIFTKLLHLTEVMHFIKAQWVRFTRFPDGPPPENRK